MSSAIRTCRTAAANCERPCAWMSFSAEAPAPACLLACWLLGCVRPSTSPLAYRRRPRAPRAPHDRPRRRLSHGRACMPGSTGCGRLCANLPLFAPLCTCHPSRRPPFLTRARRYPPMTRVLAPRVCRYCVRTGLVFAQPLCLASQSTCHMSSLARRPQAGDEWRRRTLCRQCRQAWRAATRSRRCPRYSRVSSCQREGGRMPPRYHRQTGRCDVPPACAAPFSVSR